jgi:hypothetical protein
MIILHDRKVTIVHGLKFNHKFQSLLKNEVNFSIVRGLRDQ